MLRVMKMVLTPEQKQQLEQMHDSEGDSNVCDRIKAVLLASEGWSKDLKLFLHGPRMLLTHSFVKIRDKILRNRLN
nr:hypothetical protein [Vibrio cholerae]